ncbi:MAG: DUF262 domain-containing protein [Clostridia bacterium]|nr:DUF262 domain-containing protein [Clostridia bacterium]
MFQPIPGTLQYNTLIANIEQGIVKIPQFQRKFVWSIEQTAKLLDSILKGYPIGSFILWETKERLRSIRDIGNIHLPEPPEGYIVQYVLDGQQRMTSLYVSMMGVKITGDDKRTIDYSEIYVDFEASMDEEIVITDISGRNMDELIKFTDLLNGGYKMFAKYPTYGEKLERYSNAFKTYLFSTILIKDAPIDIATEIFTRINVGGKPLSVFEIMVAKTYDSIRNFDLSEKYDALIERLQNSNCNYDTISSSTVLQAVSVCLTKECSKKQILKLNKDDFINIWDHVINALESAVDYFRGFYRIPVSQLLPYDSLLVPFTYFFFHHKDIPLDKKQEYLQDYFWRVVLTSRFSTSLEAKIGQDIRKIDLILSDQHPDYDEPVDITPEYLCNHGWFATGTAYIKGFLCILAYQQPKSFANNALVNISNSWLKQANSKNYHHFFPKAYLAKRNFENWEINHIANITIVDDFLNKRSIRDRAPSKYIADYQKINPDLEATLATHLIGPIEESGITNNDYDKFFNHRLQHFSNELRKRLILQPSDHS